MIEALLGCAVIPLPIRPTAVVTAAAVKVARQLLSELECGRRIDDTVLRIATEAASGVSDATGGAWNLMTACDACEAGAILFLCSCGNAVRVRSSYLSPTLRCATMIAVKGFRSFGPSANGCAPPQSGEILAGVQSVSARPHRRTGKT